MNEDQDNLVYHVVRNHEEQYSVWPDGKELPAGWDKLEISGTKDTCLDYIERVWTDIRPLSLRKSLGLA
jgi:MbtH protein